MVFFPGVFALSFSLSLPGCGCSLGNILGIGVIFIDICTHVNWSGGSYEYSYRKSLETIQPIFLAVQLLL